MAAFKDLFSADASDYARYRPQYPPALAAWLAGQTPYRGVAWDCATGSGQLALLLEPHYQLVCATDASEAQLATAPGRKGILYSCQPAFPTDFPDEFFDLITVGQAIHWFATDAFYDEVKRVARPGAIFACIGYGLCSTGHPATDEWLQHFYRQVAGPFWEPERRYIDDGYRSLPFPFETQLATPTFSMQQRWQVADMLGYLGTWSALKKLRQQRADAAVLLEREWDALAQCWPAGQLLTVHFPLLLRVARL
ncbi:MAG: class I SAM-dependent methyltransferase [Chitinophagaceae bacterium]|jgi:SAM-dependent methyltransferase|nr:class I SAM-dependent methyltransferase [Chitinophagaceae bacterium]